MPDVPSSASRKADGEFRRVTRERERPAARGRRAVILTRRGLERRGGLQTLGDVPRGPLENGKASRVVFYDVRIPKAASGSPTVERPDRRGRQRGLAERQRQDAPSWSAARGTRRSTSTPPPRRTSPASISTYVEREGRWREDHDRRHELRRLPEPRRPPRVRRPDLPPRHASRGRPRGRGLRRPLRPELGAKPVITKIAKRHMYCAASGEDAQCKLRRRHGAYVTPSGALHVYAVEHDNDGPGVHQKEF